METPPDYDAKVFRSLIEPVRLLGIHRETAIALWGLSVMLVFSGHKLSNAWVLLVAAAVNGVLAVLTKRDPDILSIIGHALFFPKRLDP